MYVLENDRYEREFSLFKNCRRTTNAIDTDDRKLDIHSSLVCIEEVLTFHVLIELHRGARMKLRVMKVHTGTISKWQIKKAVVVLVILLAVHIHMDYIIQIQLKVIATREFILVGEEHVIFVMEGSVKR